MQVETIFSRIINGELPCDKVFENERILVIKDISPVAPIHFLLIPKKPIVDLQSVSEEDLGLMAEIVAIAQNLARQYGVEKGYRLLTNNGAEAGQTVFHLHFHLIGGKPLGKIG